MNIRTPRLELVPATAALIRMELAEHERLGQRLRALVPDAWPPDSVREALEFFAQDLEARPEQDGWRVWYWISRSERGELPVLVGSGGFKGPPDDQGRVEVGYGTLGEYQGRGYATEAVRGLVAWAFSQGTVARVVADASPDNAASVRVLRKNGFAPVGAGAEPDTDRYERRRE